MVSPVLPKPDLDVMVCRWIGSDRLVLGDLGRRVSANLCERLRNDLRHRAIVVVSDPNVAAIKGHTIGVSADFDSGHRVG